MASSKKPDLKGEALREHGALNLYPERITDRLFLEGDFFDPRDRTQVKYEMIRRAQKDGWSVAQAARVFGFSRVAFYRALASFKQAGLSGLLRQRPGPRHPHKLSKEVMDYLETAVGEKASLSAPELARMVSQRFGVSIHHRTIERALTHRKKKRR